MGMALFAAVLFGFQSTPPARGATEICKIVISGKYDFNPRPPRGGRHGRDQTAVIVGRFQSTPPARGATMPVVRVSSGRRHFNPRPPRGGRPAETPSCPADSGSISIHAPREGGDYTESLRTRHRVISIHAPREGGDWRTQDLPSLMQNFNPRPPRGGRQPSTDTKGGAGYISIHAPREGGDLDGNAPACRMCISIHAPREGGDVLKLLSLPKI